MVTVRREKLSFGIETYLKKFTYKYVSYIKTTVENNAKAVFYLLFILIHEYSLYRFIYRLTKKNFQFKLENGLVIIDKQNGRLRYM
jgi:hypothetical protein